MKNHNNYYVVIKTTPNTDRGYLKKLAQMCGSNKHTNTSSSKREDLIEFYFAETKGLERFLVTMKTKAHEQGRVIRISNLEKEN